MERSGVDQLLEAEFLLLDLLDPVHFGYALVALRQREIVTQDPSSVFMSSGDRFGDVGLYSLDRPRVHEPSRGRQDREREGRGAVISRHVLSDRPL